MTELVALGLGSNLGDKRKHITEAVSVIAKSGLLTDVLQSRFLLNKALLPEDAPKDWDLDFLNVVIIGKTSLTPSALFSAIKDIEKAFGRVATEKWAPREIDIDILIYNNQSISTKELIIPHKELLNRKFAVCLLADIAPEWKYPIEGKFYQQTLAEIVAELYPDEATKNHSHS